MALVALDITGENKDLIAKLMQLEKRTESLEARLQNMGNSASRSAHGAATAFGHMAKEAFSVAVALTGVGSVEAVIHKVVEKFRKGIEEMRRLRDDALGTQQTFADALGKFVSNNPTLSKDEVARWAKFAEEQGKTGVSGGAPGVLSALSDLRGSTAGSSAEDQMAAMAEAVKRKRLDPNTDLAQYSQAVLKIKEDLGISIVDASNKLSIYGERAGGDIAGLAGNIGKLKGLSGLNKGNINDALALHAFLTTEMGDPTGENSTTVVANLLARAATRDVTLGGKQVQLKGETGMDRVLETIDRINAGDFGDPARALTEYTRELGRESASAVIALGSLRTAGGKFAETRSLIAEGASGVNLTEQGLATKRALTPAYGAMEGVKKEGAAAEAAAQGNVSGATVAAAEKELKAFNESMGITGVWDLSRPLRRLAAERDMPMSEYLAAEKARRVRAAVGARGPFSLSGPGTSLEAMGAQAALNAARTPDEMLAVGARSGAVDAATRLDLLEQRMLEAAGASPERIAELQGMFEKGLKDAFKEGLSELLMELRQNKTTTRQELD